MVRQENTRIDMTDQSLVKGTAAVLLVTVASQIFYITVVTGSDNEALRPLTWFTELFAFAISAIFAHALAARRPGEAVVWSTIAFAGVLNVLQVGMGLSMFAPAMEAGESVPATVRRDPGRGLFPLLFRQAPARRGGHRSRPFGVARSIRPVQTGRRRRSTIRSGCDRPVARRHGRCRGMALCSRRCGHCGNRTPCLRAVAPHPG